MEETGRIEGEEEVKGEGEGAERGGGIIVFA